MSAELVLLTKATFNPWYSGVVGLYGSSCLHVFDAGLRGFLFPQNEFGDKEWAAIPGNLIDDPLDPGTLTPRDRPNTNPVPNPAANAQSIAMWTVLTKNRDSVVTSLATNKNVVIASLSAADKDALRQGNMELLNRSVGDILTYAIAQYGTFDKSDFKAGLEVLAQKMTPSEAIADVVARHRRVHEDFSREQQPLPEFLKVDHFVEATQHIPNVGRAIGSYLTNTPSVRVQTFAAMAVHVEQQAPNFITSAPEHGYSASVINAAAAAPASAPTFDIAGMAQAFAAAMDMQRNRGTNDRRGGSVWPQFPA
eukprot:gene30357-34267_t